MVSVFLSPSDQLGNTYAYGDTNEAVVCQQISNLLEDKLNEYGVMVDSDPNMYNAVDRSNKMRPDLHLAIHTNASPGHNVRGVRVFYYPAHWPQGISITSFLCMYSSRIRPSCAFTKLSTFFPVCKSVFTNAVNGLLHAIRNTSFSLPYHKTSQLSSLMVSLGTVNQV